MSITSTTSMSTEILSASKAARTFGVRVRTLRAWAKSGLSMRPFESDGRYYVEIAKTFRGKIPQTLLTLTGAGRVAFEEYRKKKMSECVMASDAFFPFDDSIIHAAENDIRYIISPGGSIRDREVIATANLLGVSMIFTGMRHFLH